MTVDPAGQYWLSAGMGAFQGAMLGSQIENSMMAKSLNESGYTGGNSLGQRYWRAGQLHVRGSGFSAAWYEANTEGIMQVAETFHLGISVCGSEGVVGFGFSNHVGYTHVYSF